MMKVNIKGRDKVDPLQSYVIVANHQSLIDILILYGYLGMDIKWVMKQELRSVPVLGYAAKLMGHILIDRSNSGAAYASINNARQKINNGMSVVFFPEGTRSRSGEVKNFKKGAFRLAQELGLPILPVAIHGSSNILPSDTVDLMPGNVTLEFCDPIPTTGLDRSDITKLTRQARQTIWDTLQERPEGSS
jgi:1-acyl-sn-glycerol-3-phosphate acyltransferase